MLATVFVCAFIAAVAVTFWQLSLPEEVAEVSYTHCLTHPDPQPPLRSCDGR